MQLVSWHYCPQPLLWVWLAMTTVSLPLVRPAVLVAQPETSDAERQIVDRVTPVQDHVVVDPGGERRKEQVDRAYCCWGPGRLVRWGRSLVVVRGRMVAAEAVASADLDSHCCETA